MLPFTHPLFDKEIDMTDTIVSSTTADRPMLNAELLRRTMNHIIEHEEGWNQGTWRTVPGLGDNKPEPLKTPCGAAMCFAGEAVQLAEPDAWLVSVAEIMQAYDDGDNELLQFAYDNQSAVRISHDNPECSRVYDIDPRTGDRPFIVEAYTRATQLLGLTNAQRDALFSGVNTLWTLQAMVDALIDNPLITGDELSLL